jgi:hypothetical protein
VPVALVAGGIKSFATTEFTEGHGKRKAVRRDFALSFPNGIWEREKNGNSRYFLVAFGYTVFSSFVSIRVHSWFSVIIDKGFNNGSWYF